MDDRKLVSIFFITLLFIVSPSLLMGLVVEDESQDSQNQEIRFGLRNNNALSDIQFRHDQAGSVTAFDGQKIEGKQWQPVIPIKDINRRAYHFGTYLTEGYVSYIYSCLPCPKPGSYVPCMGEHIIVSQEIKNIDQEHLTESDLMIFVENIQPFSLTARYILLVQILDVKTTNQIANNVKLIYYEKVEEEENF